MPLYGLLGFDVKSPESREQWVLWHSQDHQEIHQAIQNVLGTNLVIYQLYPMDLKNLEQWAAWHQQTHDDENSATGLAGNDLSEMNFKDPKKANEWHFNHFKEHLALRSKFSI